MRSRSSTATASTPTATSTAIGAANALAGLSSGFVQSGGASQTAAADGAGGRSQLASLVAAGLILLTGAFLAPLFEDLPQATLAAIVIVAVAGFFDVGELRRFARVRRSAIVFAALALAGVLLLGVLQGLIVAARLSLVYVVARLSRPSVGALARDPATGAWGRVDRHPDGRPGRRPRRAQRRAAAVPERRRGQGPRARARGRRRRRTRSSSTSRSRPSSTSRPPTRSASSPTQLRRDGIELRLAEVRAPALEVLARSGVAERVRSSRRSTRPCG